MTDCPVCKNPIAEDAETCPHCRTHLKSNVQLSKADAAKLLENSSAFFAEDLDDAEAMKECLENAGFHVTLLTQDLTEVGLSLHDTHGYKLVVDVGEAEEAFRILRKQVPRALFAELESGLGFTIEEMVRWDLRPDFGRSLLPGTTMEEFLRRALGDEAAEEVLRGREARAIGPDAVKKTLAEAFAEEDVDHDELLEDLAPASAGAVDALLEGVVRACREGRDDILWPACHIVQRLPREPRTARLHELEGLARQGAGDARRLAVLALGIIADGRSATALVELLKDGDEKVRYEAIDALSNFVGEDFGFLSDASDGDRAAAVKRWEEWLRKRGAGTT